MPRTRNGLGAWANAGKSSSIDLPEVVQGAFGAGECGLESHRRYFAHDGVLPPENGLGASGRTAVLPVS